MSDQEFTDKFNSLLSQLTEQGIKNLLNGAIHEIMRRAVLVGREACAQNLESLNNDPQHESHIDFIGPDEKEHCAWCDVIEKGAAKIRARGEKP